MPDASELIPLSIVNWLHLMATVVWIGGMVTNVLAILPTAKETLEPPVMGRFMGGFVKRSRPIIYTSMAVLVVTGGLMMTLNENYTGMLNFDNIWAVSLLVKHILVVVLIILAVYTLQVIFPKIGRATAKGPSPELAKLQSLQVRVGIAALITALLILLLTAIDGAISALA